MPNLPQAGVQLVAQGAPVFIDSMGRAHDAVGRFVKMTESSAQSIDSAGRHFSGFSEVVTGALREVGALAVKAFAAAGAAAFDFTKDAIKQAGDFEQGLSVLQAVTGATNDEMQKIRKTSIALGNDITLPATSAQDAAKAMTELAKAGLSVNDSLAAAKGTLQLATAAETDAANAATIVAGALNAFHLAGDQATMIADQLTAGANASAASITDMAQGFQQAGFMFYATGQKTDDLIASLGLLTNVGLTGSDAGTALKNAAGQPDAEGRRSHGRPGHRCL
jgi:minor tail protein